MNAIAPVNSSVEEHTPKNKAVYVAIRNLPLAPMLGTLE